MKALFALAGLFAAASAHAAPLLCIGDAQVRDTASGTSFCEVLAAPGKRTHQVLVKKDVTEAKAWAAQQTDLKGTCAVLVFGPAPAEGLGGLGDALAAKGARVIYANAPAPAKGGPQFEKYAADVRGMARGQGRTVLDLYGMVAYLQTQFFSPIAGAPEPWALMSDSALTAEGHRRVADMIARSPDWAGTCITTEAAAGGTTPP